MRHRMESRRGPGRKYALLWISVEAPSIKYTTDRTTNKRLAMSTAKQTLRKRLAGRQQEKAELEQQVRGYQTRYREEVAPLKEQVLRLQRDRLRAAAQAHMRNARLRNAYHDAQQAYDAFQEAREGRRSYAPETIKALYRRATKHCHPDRVPAPYRAEAKATFQSLEAAYGAGDEPAVAAIANALEQWGFPRRTSAGGDPGRSTEALSAAVASLEAAIQRLRSLDAYQDLQEAGDPEAAIEAQKHALVQQMRRLGRSDAPTRQGQGASWAPR